MGDVTLASERRCDSCDAGGPLTFSPPHDAHFCARCFAREVSRTPDMRRAEPVLICPVCRHRAGKAGHIGCSLNGVMQPTPVPYVPAAEVERLWAALREIDRVGPSRAANRNTWAYRLAHIARETLDA